MDKNNEKKDNIQENANNIQNFFADLKRKENLNLKEMFEDAGIKTDGMKF